MRPVYGGMRAYEPGNRNGRYHGSLANAVEATWPALVDAETFHKVRALLQNPDRKTTRPGRAVHLLSLIAVCDVCGGLAARYPKDRGGERQYACRERNCVRITADDLDRIAEDVMLAYLADDDVIKRLRAATATAGPNLPRSAPNLPGHETNSPPCGHSRPGRSATRSACPPRPWPRSSLACSTGSPGWRTGNANWPRRRTCAT